MPDLQADIDRTIQDLIARRDDANNSIDEALVAMRKDIQRLRIENEALMRRISALEAGAAATAPRLAMPAAPAPVLRGANDR